MIIALIALIGVLLLALLVFWAWLINRPVRGVSCTDGGDEHKFEPRYSEEGAFPPGFDKMSDFHKTITMTVNGTAPAANKKTYIYDICARCGKTVKGCGA